MGRKPKFRTITIVAAPGIPAGEVEALRKDYDRGGTLVKNYEVKVDSVTVDPNTDRLVVVAPGVSQAELKALQKYLKAAEKRPSYTIVTNYDVSVWTVPKYLTQA